MNDLESRKRLIDTFVNSIYLYNDKIVFAFNYKDGTKAVTLAESEEELSSDLEGATSPQKNSTLKSTLPMGNKKQKFYKSCTFKRESKARFEFSNLAFVIINCFYIHCPTLPLRPKLDEAICRDWKENILHGAELRQILHAL